MFDREFDREFNSIKRSHRRVGTLLKIWFVIVAVLALSIFGFVGYTIFTAISLAGNPEAIGDYVGRIKSGYERAIGE